MQVNVDDRKFYPGRQGQIRARIRDFAAYGYPRTQEARSDELWCGCSVNRAGDRSVVAILRGGLDRMESIWSLDEGGRRPYLTGGIWLRERNIRSSVDVQLSEARSTPGGARPSFAKCLRILVISAWSWMIAITRISQPHFSQTNGYTS